MRRLLILGGTAEAFDLAAALEGASGLSVISSLAGRTRTPRLPRAGVRVGGFGGAGGLAAYLLEQGIDAVIDATHPFAAAIAAHAVTACARTEVPRLALVRPPWMPQAGDQWTEAADMDEAARELGTRGGTVFVATGRQSLEALKGVDNCRFVVRLVDPVTAPLPISAEVVIGRGPFSEVSERSLFETWKIDLILAKNSGGTATYGKIAAARALKLPVVMIRRPAPPPGPTAIDVAGAVEWLSRTLPGQWSLRHD